jgi:hypothetical protein
LGAADGLPTPDGHPREASRVADAFGGGSRDAEAGHAGSSISPGGSTPRCPPAFRSLVGRAGTVARGRLAEPCALRRRFVRRERRDSNPRPPGVTVPRRGLPWALAGLVGRSLRGFPGPGLVGVHHWLPPLLPRAFRNGWGRACG